MAKRTSEQSSYSVDEMMEKLREGERVKRRTEESELVTRPDGSQVVRIRRRRRRTQQPHKAKQIRKRRYGMLGLIVFAVALVGLGGTVLILLARFNSKGFRDDLKEQIYSATGAKTGISDFAVTPLRVRAKSMKFTWPPGGIPKSLSLNGVSADLEITSLFGAEWNGKEAIAQSGSLLLGPPDGTIVRTLADGDLPFHYPGYRCLNTEIVYGKNADEPTIRVTGAEMTMRPLEKGGVQFLVNGGRASIGNWEELKVSRGMAELKDGKFDLVSLRTTPGTSQGGGEATVRSVKPARAGDPALLNVDLLEYPIEELLGSSAGLGRLVSGVVHTKEKDPGIISVDPRFLDSGKMAIRIEGEAVTLQEFQFLGVLSDLLRRDFYSRPTGHLKGILKQDRTGIRIQNFEFHAKSDLKLSGQVEMAKTGELLGVLRVGIPESIVTRSETQRRLFSQFSNPELGYCWIDIKLGGFHDRPADNFSSVLRGDSLIRPEREPGLSPNRGFTPPGTPEEEPILPVPDQNPVPETEFERFLRD